MGVIKHVFSNAIADGTNTAIVRPSDWNSSHAYTLQDAVSLGGNTSGVLALISSGLLLLAGGSNVTLSQNGNSVTVSAADAPAPLFFSNANGVSFGSAGVTITATVQTNYMASASSSVFAKTGFTTTTVAGAVVAGTHDTAGLKLAVPAYLTTAQPVGAYLTTARGSTDALGLGTAQTNVTWTADSRGVSLNAGGYAGTGFTSTTTAGTAVVGTNNTAGLSLGVPALLTTAALSNHSHGNPQLNLTNLSGTTASNSAGFTLSLSASPPGGGAQTAISGVIVSDATYTSGTVSFSNQANITIGSSVNGATQYIRLSGNPAQTNQSAIRGLGASNTGNTAGNTGLSTGIDWVLAGSNNITVSESTVGGGPNTLWISGAAAGGAQTAISGVVASDTTYSSGTVIWSGQNNITVGSSVNGASQYVRLSVGAYITTARRSTDALGLATAGTNMTWTANSDGLSINAGGYAGTGFTTTTVAGAVIAGTHDTLGLKLAVPAFLTTAQPVGAYLTTARASNDAIGLNTAQTNATWTVNSSGLSFNAGGYAGTGFTRTTTAGTEIEATNNTAGLSMAVPVFLTTAALSQDSSKYAGTTTGFAGANISGSMTHNTLGLNLSLSVAAPGGGANLTLQDSATTLQVTKAIFSNANGVSFGFATAASLATVTASVAAQSNQTLGLYASTNTIGQSSSSTFDARTISISAIGALSAGMSGNALQLSVPQTSSLVGAGGITISTAGSTMSVSYSGIDRSMLEIMDGERLVTCCAVTGASFSKRPILVPFWMDGNALQPRTVRFLVSQQAANASLNMTMGVGFYSAANSSSLNLAFSTTNAFSLTTSALWSGVRVIDITGFTNATHTLSEGRWMMGVYVSGSNDSTVVMNMNFMGGDPIANVGFILAGTNSTAATNSGSRLFPFWGVWNATTAAFPAAIAASSIAGGASNLQADIYAALLEIAP